MLDEGGFDYGVLTGIGLIIASAAILIFVFALFGSMKPANTAIALENAACEVSGDLETVGSIAVPYSESRYYGFDGIGVLVSEDRVTATMGGVSFSKPLTIRISPGKYVDNGSIRWNDTEDFRHYLKVSFNATGTIDDPLDPVYSARLGSLMRKAASSTLLSPVQIVPKRPLLIERSFVYLAGNYTVAPEVNAYVFVYQG
jgi:hypothetical protein